MSRLWSALAGRSGEPSTYFLSREVFLRVLGAVFFTAFVSLWTQIDGLVGSQGILSVSDFLEAVREQTGSERYWLVPTLFWLSASDSALQVVCGGGAVLSLLLVLGIAAGPVLLLLWLFYLSLVAIGRDFLMFQWDHLLLEAGFLALFLAPWRAWFSRSRGWGASPPSSAVLWLFRWLLFRLLLSSGLVKLLSGDESWRNLTALTVHYETQPLPHWISWYAHQLPGWFHQASVVGMFAVELGVPVLIFAPRRLRGWACGAIVALQLILVVTGNYTFFNWLTIALCVLLLDDAYWRRFFPRRWAAMYDWATWEASNVSLIRRQMTTSSLSLEGVAQWGRRIGMVALVVMILFVSGTRLLGLWVEAPAFAQRVVAWTAPLRAINGYGLFAIMTTSRPEIIIEGSNDQQTWRAYEFKWKPGDPRRRPGFVAPHQPRLDWQMWFAALGEYRDNPWVINFLVRLLEGSPEVLALLEINPFPDAPPRFVRAMVYDYRFTDFDTRRATQAWWRRRVERSYTPVLTLSEP